MTGVQVILLCGIETKMNWDAIGAVGEIVGAGAVIVTLLYLASQIQQATRATQAASVQTASALDQEFLLVLGQDPVAARVWTAYTFGDRNTLSEDEQRQGYYLFASILRRLENIYHQHQLGTISEEVWRTRQGMHSAIAQSPAYAAHMQGPAGTFMSGEFVAYMNQLASNEGSTGLRP